MSRRFAVEVEYGRVDAFFDRMTDFCGAAFGAAIATGWLLTRLQIPHARAIEAGVVFAAGTAYAVFGQRTKRKTVRILYR